MFQQKLNRIISLLFLSILAGCSDKKKQVHIKQASHNLELQETVARLTMIPDAPIGFTVYRVINDATLQNNSQIQYRASKKGTVDLELLKNSYQADMELLGWNSLSQFCADGEMMLLFERPGGSLCQVSYDDGSGLRVTILSIKKGL